jgi:hypothetical protein
MAVPMDALVGQNETVVRIDDHDDFEKISSFDVSFYFVDVGKTCLCLHQSGAVDYRIGS